MMTAASLSVALGLVCVRTQTPFVAPCPAWAVALPRPSCRVSAACHAPADGRNLQPVGGTPTTYSECRMLCRIHRAFQVGSRLALALALALVLALVLRFLLSVVCGCGLGLGLGLLLFCAVRAV